MEGHVHIAVVVESPQKQILGAISQAILNFRDMVAGQRLLVCLNGSGRCSAECCDNNMASGTTTEDDTAFAAVTKGDLRELEYRGGSLPTFVKVEKNDNRRFGDTMATQSTMLQCVLGASSSAIDQRCGEAALSWRSVVRTAFRL
jgi:hypothetical protein